MKKVKRSEVPKDYRRNWKKEAVEVLKIALSGVVFGIILSLLIFLFLR